MSPQDIAVRYNIFTSHPLPPYYPNGFLEAADTVPRDDVPWQHYRHHLKGETMKKLNFALPRQLCGRSA